MLGQAGDLMKMAKNPAESERIRGLASAFAAVEKEQRAALREHAEALDADPDALGIHEPPEQEQRVTELCEAVGARFSGSVWETWCEHVAPDDLRAEEAKEYAGIGAEAWAEEREAIVERWREDPKLNTDGYDDEQLVAADIRSRFDVEPEQFRTYVVQFSPVQLFETLLAGEFEANTEAIEALTEEVAE